MEQAIIPGVAHDPSEAKITVVGVPDRVGDAARIFKAIAEAGINIDMIVQNVSARSRSARWPSSSANTNRYCARRTKVPLTPATGVALDAYLTDRAYQTGAGSPDAADRAAADHRHRGRLRQGTCVSTCNRSRAPPPGRAGARLGRGGPLPAGRLDPPGRQARRLPREATRGHHVGRAAVTGAHYREVRGRAREATRAHHVGRAAVTGAHYREVRGRAREATRAHHVGRAAVTGAH